MRRRGFLGFLGGAAIAGPKIAQEAVRAAGVESMMLPTMPWPGPEEGFTGSNMKTMSTEIGEYSHGDYLRDRLAEVVGVTAAEKAERMASMTITALDPDLAVNRSMQLWAKVAEQKRRNVERQWQNEHRSLTRQLAEWLKSQAALA